MITGKTEEGFKYKINESIADDYRVLELLVLISGQVNDMDALKFGIELPKLVFGEEQLNKYINFLKNRDGYASTQKIMNATIQVFEKAKKGEPVKNF